VAETGSVLLSEEEFRVNTIGFLAMWIDFLQAAGISGKATKFPHEDRNRIIGREKWIL